MFPFPGLPFPSREERERRGGGWMGGNWGHDRGKRGGGTCGPKVQKDRMRVWGRGCVWVAPVLGPFQSWPLPGCQELLVRSQQRKCRKRGGGLRRGGRGVWTNQHIHDRCLLRKIQENRHANITGRVCFLTPLASPPACFPQFCQSSVRRSWGQGWGLLGEVCSAYPCWPPPLHSPGEQSFLCKCHPQSELPGLVRPPSGW